METKKIRIIIAGSRGYDNYAFLKQRVLEILKQKNLTIDQIIIVSGTASGADKLGERFAMEMGADCCLVNTAIAVAGDPVEMARAFKEAVIAGRRAYEAGLGAISDCAEASSPLTSFLNI